MRPLLLIATLLVGCSPADLLDSLRPRSATAHERYGESLRQAGLDSTALGREWLAASDSALRDPLIGTVPIREVGAYVRDEARAVAWQVDLAGGQRVEVTVRADGLPARLFLDLFEATDDPTRPFEHRATADTSAVRAGSAASLELVHEVRRDGRFMVRLQPELLRAGRYEVVVRVAPILAFPVEGQGNRAIRSLFGAARDGGVRSHHGIDIFAPRGTPVLAVTAGVVRSTRPNQLGGNVVWLRDEVHRQSIYYAHLDSVRARRGEHVEPGDTIGFVGNTGNARTTATHLHFGIYGHDRGPVDPLPWVRLIVDSLPMVRADTSRLGRRAITRATALTLRAGPSRTAVATHDVAPDTPLRILGANAGWYRVQLDDGRAGYLAEAALHAVD